MRRIFAILFVVVAVTITNSFADDDSEMQNKIDVFIPKLVDNRFRMDRSARAFYYKYYGLNAGRSTGVQMEYNHTDPLTFKDIFEGPVLVIITSPTVQETFAMFYIHTGLGNMYRYHAFSSLQEFFKTPRLKGLVFYPHLVHSQRFSNTPLSSITVQEDLRISDFLSVGSCNGKIIPYVFVASEEAFDQMNFEDIVKVSNFVVYNDTVEVYPISVNRPLDLPFNASQKQAPQSGKALGDAPTGLGRSGTSSTFGSKTDVNILESETGTQSLGETQKQDQPDFYPGRTFLRERELVRSTLGNTGIHNRRRREIETKGGRGHNYKSNSDRTHQQKDNNLRFEFDKHENEGGVKNQTVGSSNSDTRSNGSPIHDESSARPDSDVVESEVHSQNGITGTIGNFIRTGAGIIGNVASGLVKSVQTGAEIVEDVAEGAVKTGTALVKTGTHIAENVGTAVVKTGAELVRTGTEIVEGVGTGIVHAGTEAVERGADIAGNVGVGVVHVGAQVVRTGTGVVADVGSGLIRTGAEIVGTVGSDFAEKGTQIVGDVAKIVRTNINVTAQNVRNEFTRHRVHEHLREQPEQPEQLSSVPETK